MKESAGEKTEQPTPRRLEEAQNKGQLPRSAEVQTVFVLLAALAALAFMGREMWSQLAGMFSASLSHLHDTDISLNTLQGGAVQGAAFIGVCVGPLVGATVLGGLLAGGVQNRFAIASEALRLDWARINPVNGFQRLFSAKQFVPALTAMLKLVVIIGLSYSEIVRVFNHPIFANTVSLGDVTLFFGEASLRILIRVGLALGLVAAADYGWQWWSNSRDMMMTRQEIKEEMKSTEGNPQIKAARRRRQTVTKRRMLAEVPGADVVLTNPTHLAVALRYDRGKMKAPRIVAKGSRLNAQQIKEIARRHQVPVLENKPLARMLFKYGRVGAEIPAHLYAAVAEVLAWVYRSNRYRYFAEQNRA